jgi:hypothetical protein
MPQPRTVAALLTADLTARWLSSVPGKLHLGSAFVPPISADELLLLRQSRVRVNERLMNLEEDARTERAKTLGEGPLKVTECWGVWIQHQDGAGQCSRGEDCSTPEHAHVLAFADCSVLDPCPACDARH